MCILSRSGKAVKIHQTFRLLNNDEEKRRVVQAGGTVVNQRYIFYLFCI
jgi:hypothetical protein